MKKGLKTLKYAGFTVMTLLSMYGAMSLYHNIQTPFYLEKSEGFKKSIKDYIVYNQIEETSQFIDDLVLKNRFDPNFSLELKYPIIAKIKFDKGKGLLNTWYDRAKNKYNELTKKTN